MRLAGTYHPIVYVLSRIEELIPGIQNYGALFSDGNKIKFQLNQEEIDLSETELIKIQKFRSSQKSLNFWLDSPEAPLNALAEGQYSFYSEQQLNTLCIGIPKEFCASSLPDFLLIQFPKEFSFSSNLKEFNALTSSEKFLLEKIVGSTLLAEVKRVKKEQKLLAGIVGVNHKQRVSIESLRQELANTQQIYVSTIGRIIQDIIKEVSLLYGVRFSVTDELIYLFAKSRCNLEQIQHMLNCGAEVAYHLNFNDQNILLSCDHIELPDQGIDVSVDAKQTSLDRTFDLLNRYEEAAMRLKQSNQAINGKNLAASMHPSISPPAISDAIRKNGRRIRYYLKEYPNNWLLIRSNIKGIERLDERSLGFSQAI